ncbi:MAG: hypothetical protein JWP34_4308, partial [Massilia sp.]|nr:hypothetical protein [Massilia sp.]
PYLRRIAALAVFGALHHIFLFAGDILFSYAVAAVFLLVVLYGTWKWLVAAIVVCIGLAFIPGFGPGAGGAAGTLAFAGLIALYMRNEKRPLSMPVMALILLVLGVVALAAAAVMFALNVGPAEARGPAAGGGSLLLVLSFLANKYHDPIEARPWRAGAAIYLSLLTMMTIGGLVDYLTSPEPATPAAPVAAVAAAKADPKKAAVKPELTEAQKKAERAAEREKHFKERAQAIATEHKVLSTGSYAEVVKLRAKHFAERAPGESGFATILIGMFLIGTWFIRSGVMKNTGAHLPLFRKLAYFGLPVGIGMGLLGSLIATTHVPGAQHDGWQPQPSR